MTAHAHMLRMQDQAKLPVAVPITHDGDQAVWITSFPLVEHDHYLLHHDPEIRACYIAGLMAWVHDRAASAEDVTT